MQLPDHLSIPELAFVLQYDLIHPDLRPEGNRVGNDRVSDIGSLVPCKSCRIESEAAQYQFRPEFVEIACALAEAVECEEQIDDIDKRKDNPQLDLTK